MILQKSKIIIHMCMCIRHIRMCIMVYNNRMYQKIEIKIIPHANTNRKLNTLTTRLEDFFTGKKNFEELAYNSSNNVCI